MCLWICVDLWTDKFVDLWTDKFVNLWTDEFVGGLVD